MSHQCVLMRQEQQTLGNSLGFRGLHLFHTGQKTHLHLLTSGFWMQCEYIIQHDAITRVEVECCWLFVAVYIIQAATEVKDIKKVAVVCSFRVVFACGTCQRSERSDEFNS